MADVRKIETREIIAKRRQRNQIIVGAILIILMVVSTLGFAFLSNREQAGTGGNGEKMNVSGLEFTRSGDRWTTILGNSQISFRYLPNETANVSIFMNKTLQDYYQKPLYIVNDANSAAAMDIVSVMDPYVLRYQPACIGSMNCSEDLPKKTCEDNVIVISGGNVTNSSVMQIQNCIYLQGNYLEGAAAFLYRILGVTE